MKIDPVFKLIRAKSGRSVDKVVWKIFDKYILTIWKFNTSHTRTFNILLRRKYGLMIVDLTPGEMNQLPELIIMLKEKSFIEWDEVAVDWEVE